MKKRLFLGVALALVAILMLSCNKNRFDFDNLETVEGSGQWKLPIGNVSTTLGDVLEQLGENDLISYDEDGNLQIHYSFKLNDILKGSSFLSLGTMNFSSEIRFANPFPGYHLTDPIDTVYRFQQSIELDADSAVLETAVIKTCTMLSTIQGNLGNVSRVEISSSDITMPNGDSLFTTQSEVDLAGASFHLYDDFGNPDTVVVFNYAIYYQLEGIDDEEYHFETILGMNNLKLKQLSGHVNQFVYEFDIDTTFSLPLGNIDGNLNLVGAKVNVKERNSFENLYAQLSINTAEFYGGSLAPSTIFDHYPFVLNVVPSYDYVSILDDETVNLSLNPKYDAVRFAGLVDFNPNAVDNLVTIYDTSTLSVAIDAIIPMQFNVPGVTYIDTISLNLGEISAPSLVKEIILGMMFESELPFNLSVQLDMYKSTTGEILGGLVDHEMLVNGSFDGTPVLTNESISITQDLLKKLLESDMLIMRVGVNTGGNDVLLNLDNGLGVTLKADVLYGGSMDVNN
jgi:hypothetical protein